jgi:hypothetical protein
MLTGAGSRAKIKYAVGARYGSEKNNNFRSTTLLLTTTNYERKWGGGAGVYLMSPAASPSSFDMLLFSQFCIHLSLPFQQFSDPDLLGSILLAFPRCGFESFLFFNNIMLSK